MPVDAIKTFVGICQHVLTNNKNPFQQEGAPSLVNDVRHIGRGVGLPDGEKIVGGRTAGNGRSSDFRLVGGHPPGDEKDDYYDKMTKLQEARDERARERERIRQDLEDARQRAEEVRRDAEKALEDAKAAVLEATKKGN